MMPGQDNSGFEPLPPLTLWFTGLSASGKSTLASGLALRLFRHGHRCTILDGDHLRLGLNQGLSFTEDDRRENIRRTAHVARLMNDAGLIVLVSLISPSIRDRALAKDIVGPQRFSEIHVSTPLPVCESRDTKGLYALARQGLVTHFTGISAPYEAPVAPALSLPSLPGQLDHHLDKLMAYVLAHAAPP